MNWLRTIVFAGAFVGTVAVWVPSMILAGETHEPMRPLGPLQWFGFAAITAGAALSGRSIQVLVTQGRGGTPAPFDPPRAHVVTGPYRYVRNPMYIGLFVALLGEAAWFRSRGLLTYAIGAVVAFHLFVLLIEEPGLRRRFGETYERYCRDVPRWIPRRPRQLHPTTP